MKTTQRHGFDIFETMLSYNDNEVGTVSWDDDRRKKKGNRKYAMRIMTHPLPWHRPEHEKRISARNCNLCLEMKTRIHSSSHWNLGHILFCVVKGTYIRVGCTLSHRIIIYIAAGPTIRSHLLGLHPCCLVIKYYPWWYDWHIIWVVIATNNKKSRVEIAKISGN